MFGNRSIPSKRGVGHAQDYLSSERKGLEDLLAFVRSGLTVIVWKLDRLGRSLKDLIETLNLLKSRGVDFISLTERIDTTIPGGKLIFHLMGALAEFERDLIKYHQFNRKIYTSWIAE